MSNLDWLYKARRPYWEEAHPGKRYKMFRAIKNNATSGQYTLELISQRTGISAVSIRNLESGISLDVPENKNYVENLLPKLIEDLGITEEQFNSDKKIKAPKVKKAPKVVAKTEVMKNPKDSTKSAPTKVTRASKSTSNSTELTVVNHTLETFVFLIKGDKLHILDDSADSLKKNKGAVWVAPADDVGRGLKLMPRSTVLKKS